MHCETVYIANILLGVYLCRTIGVASVYQPSLNTSTAGSFIFMKSGEIKKVYFPPKLIFLSFSSRTHAENPYLLVI